MSQPQQPNYCPHKLNPVTCWHCYQDKVRASQGQHVSRGQPQPAQTAIPNDAAARAASFGAPVPVVRVPAPRGPQETRPSDAPRPKPAREVLQAAQQMASQAQAAVDQRGSVWTQDASGLDVPPPKRPELIERMTTHPEARKA